MITFKSLPAMGLAILALSLPGPIAWAHSMQRDSTPADGSVLDRSPATIEIRFTAPIRVTLLRLLDDAGNARPLERAGASAAVESVQVRPEPLPPGRYKVQWRGLSADGHPAQGGLAFEVKR